MRWRAPEPGLGTDRVPRATWYGVTHDGVVRLTDNPVARLNRSVAVGEADGAQAGLAALAALDPALPRSAAVAAYLHERNADPATAARLYADAALSAPNLPEREHLTRQAARLNARLVRRAEPGSRRGLRPECCAPPEAEGRPSPPTGGAMGGARAGRCPRATSARRRRRGRPPPARRGPSPRPRSGSR